MTRAARAIARAATVALALAGCHRPQPTSSGACVEPATRPADVVIAGSGATVPLARALVDLYIEAYPERDVFVAESIGTGGAIRAIGDGAIEVGLGSRDIDEAGLSVRRVAIAAIRLGAHPSIAPGSVSWEFLLDAVRGEAVWPDGKPVVFIHREPGDSGIRAISAGAPDLASAVDDGRERGPVTAYTDADALHELTTIPGAIGLYDPVAAELSGVEVSELRVDGAATWSRPLTFFWASDDAEIRHFASFLQSEAAQSLVRSLGYNL